MSTDVWESMCEHTCVSGIGLGGASYLNTCFSIHVFVRTCENVHGCMCVVRMSGLCGTCRYNGVW